MKLDRTFPDHSLLGTMVTLAQSAFFETLPANTEQRRPVAPSTLAPTKRTGFIDRSLDALDAWFERQRQKDREAYLARATDLVDLEWRLRELERHPYY